MTREQLEHAIRAAGAICGDREVYVVGSQAILGAEPNAHADLRRSMAVDIAPKNRPELEALLEGSIGELSPFHQTFGFYVDGVEIDAIALPRGWQDRVVPVENANTNGVRGLCLDPTDLAVSKLAAGRPKDLEFVGVLLREHVITVEALVERAALVERITSDQQSTLREALARVCGRASGRTG
jgi:hypothetical protein